MTIVQFWAPAPCMVPAGLVAPQCCFTGVRRHCGQGAESDRCFSMSLPVPEKDIAGLLGCVGQEEAYAILFTSVPWSDRRQLKQLRGGWMTALHMLIDCLTAPPDYFMIFSMMPCVLQPV